MIRRMCFTRAALLSLLAPKNLLLLLALASGAALATAFTAEYVFGFRPCHLCVLQRWPHAAVAAGGLAAWALLEDPRRLRQALLAAGVLLLAGAVIAVYHTGVEYGVLPGPSGCTMSGEMPDSLEEMRRQILEAALVPCDQPAGHLLGLSFAAWSALIYTFLTILASYGYYRSYCQDVAP